MSIVTSHLSVSLDGFAAAPNQSFDNPFGEGGMRLCQWMFETDQPGREADAAVVEGFHEGIGAFVMGRNMFGGGAGDWDESWRGWWGDDPPYHGPVFVLTHHEREPLHMEGGTTFTFVTDGIEGALARAREAAGVQDVLITGGASAVRQYFAAGLLDELNLDIVPVTLGSGERLLDDVGGVELKPGDVIASPSVTHIRYAIMR